jgi:hypothetical protein
VVGRGFLKYFLNRPLEDATTPLGNLRGTRAGNATFHLSDVSSHGPRRVDLLTNRGRDEAYNLDTRLGHALAGRKDDDRGKATMLRSNARSEAPLLERRLPDTSNAE